MIYLMLKDLLIQKKSFLFMFLYSFFLFVIFNNEVFREFIYVMGGVITTYMFLITANTNDEKNRSEIVLGSLPIKRDTIVMAK